MANSGGDSNIIGGTSTTVGQYPSVVVLTIGGGLCTGTLVDKEWVITAAHCLTPEVVGVSSQDELTRSIVIHFNTVNVFTDKGREVHAAMTIPKASFNVQALGSNDIGLIKLAEPVTDIEPTPVNLDATKAPIGITVTQVGYGATAGGGGGQVGVEFALANRSSTSCSGFGVQDANLLCFNQTDNAGKCQGDSGGPSFAMIDGKQTLVGVTSFGDQFCQQFGADTRTDAERDFLLTHVPQLEGCESVADCGMNEICFNKECIAEPFSDGGLGSACTTGTECDSGVCAAGEGGMLCSDLCTAGDPNACPEGFECLVSSNGTQGACWPEDAGDGGGCCDSSGHGGPTALLGLGLVALVLRRRR
ncbi:MAG TPA: trypsin-like serine protease [Kofleriaceae bacterium]|nr:trypsin-like serine protease [Kofleriaceae bacterium]